MTLTMLGQVACVAPTTNDDEDVGEAQQAAITTNAITTNAITTNAIMMDALTDPNARELLKYLVSCALPADAHFDLEIEGVTYGFDGGVGLAPNWGEEGGSCNAKCRSWVSACVIARLDYTGESVTISVRGDHDALYASPAEQIDHPLVEATYYGDLFSSPQKIFACLPPGKAQIPRVCGPDIDDCIVEPQGECEDLCKDVLDDGAYSDCRERGKAKKHGGYHKGKKHRGAITVFLAPESP
jgi:hypothetical protein